MVWDVFLSHASEDKDEVALPLYHALKIRGVKVWMDSQEVKLGDKISQKINEALRLSKSGVVILSEDYFRKGYPQKELQALLAKETPKGGYIMPVLHRIEQEDLALQVPLIADNFSVSTDIGIQGVAEKIIDALFVQNEKHSTTSGQYFHDFEFPQRLIHSALNAIEALQYPETWNELRNTSDMSVKNIWMGNKSETTVKIIYDLYAPVVYFDFLKYELNRSINHYKLSDRFRFCLLEEISLVLQQDRKMASAGELIEYTPRSIGWRTKRIKNPQRYWWQGLTEERLRESRSSFFSSRKKSSGYELVEFETFLEQFAIDFTKGGTNQKALGLLGNPIFGFTPNERPVFWRIIKFWNFCYSLFQLELTKSNFESLFNESSSSFINSPEILALLRGNNATQSEFLFETYEQTENAVSLYWQKLVHDAIRLNLKQPVEE